VQQVLTGVAVPAGWPKWLLQQRTLACCAECCCHCAHWPRRSAAVWLQVDTDRVWRERVVPDGSRLWCTHGLCSRRCACPLGVYMTLRRVALRSSCRQLNRLGVGLWGTWLCMHGAVGCRGATVVMQRLHVHMHLLTVHISASAVAVSSSGVTFVPLVLCAVHAVAVQDGSKHAPVAPLVSCWQPLPTSEHIVVVLRIIQLLCCALECQHGLTAGQ
jgi:hypothetical protein